MMNSYILTAALTFNPAVSSILPDSDAPKYLAKALYKQQGIDKIVTRFEKRHIKLGDYPILVYTGLVVRVATEKKISYRWEF